MRLEAVSRITNSDDADRELNRLRSLVTSSALPGATKAVLTEQLESTLGIFGRQLTGAPGRSIRASRVLEGEGYRLVVQVGPAPGGLVARLAKMLGR